jgi:integrase
MSNRHPYLHRRGHIYYAFFRDQNGKRYEESLRTADLEIAKQRWAQRDQEIRSGRLPSEMGNWPFERAITRWLEHRQLRVSQGTRRAETSIARNLIRVFGGCTILRSLADIQRVRSYQDARLQAGIAPKTVNNEIQCLAGILRLAGLWQRVNDYTPLRVAKSDLPDALTEEESTRLLTVASRSEPYAVAPYAAVLAFSTGLRSGEIKGLRFADLHYQGLRPYIQVRRATTKTDAGARRVALDTIAVWAVQKLVARATLLGCVLPEHFLLPTDRARHTQASDALHSGCGYDPAHGQTSWEGEWHAFRTAAGICHRRFHDLRHTYISRAAEANVPVAVVEEQVGHIGKEMVRHYTHISEQAQFRAAQQIERLNPEFLTCLGLFPRDASCGARTPAESETAAGSTLQ